MSYKSATQIFFQDCQWLLCLKVFNQVFRFEKKPPIFNCNEFSDNLGKNEFNATQIIPNCSSEIFFFQQNFDWVLPNEHKKTAGVGFFSGKTPFFFRHSGVNATNAANFLEKRRLRIYTDKDHRYRHKRSGWMPLTLLYQKQTASMRNIKF